MTITVNPQAPVANAVSATVAYNSSANPITLNITGGTPTSVAVASGASHGTATASGTSITYTPTNGYSGSDSFTYTATNAGGTSAPATVTITVNAAVPGAPTIGTATAGDQQASVTFTAPTDTGGAPITGYEVTVQPGGTKVSGTASPITVPGLTNGQAYTFTVAAKNSAGTGAASAPSNAVTPKMAQTITFAQPASQRLDATSSNKVQSYSLEWLKEKLQYNSPLRKFRVALLASIDELERVGVVDRGRICCSAKGVEQLLLIKPDGGCG